MTQVGKSNVKPKFVRYARLFCAAAVLTVASVELWTTFNDAQALGLGTVGGAIATAAAKKFAFFG